MEKYAMFMDQKNKYSENEYTTQSNLEIQCNPIFYTFYRLIILNFSFLPLPPFDLASSFCPSLKASFCPFQLCVIHCPFLLLFPPLLFSLPSVIPFLSSFLLPFLPYFPLSTLLPFFSHCLLFLGDFNLIFKDFSFHHYFFLV